MRNVRWVWCALTGCGKEALLPLNPCFSHTDALPLTECHGVYRRGPGLLPENQHGKEGKEQQPHDPSKELLIDEGKRLSHNHERP